MKTKTIASKVIKAARHTKASTLYEVWYWSSIDWAFNTSFTNLADAKKAAVDHDSPAFVLKINFPRMEY